MVQYRKRAQAAMEFLMTYGWAILVVLIAIGALAYFGVLNPGRLLPSSCVLFPGLACGDFQVTENAVSIFIRNGMGKTLSLSSITFQSNTGGSCLSTSATIPDGSTGYITVPGCNNGAVGTRFRGIIDLVYVTDGVQHSRQGQIVAAVEQAGSVTCAGTSCWATPIFSYEEDYNPYWGPALTDTINSIPATADDEGVVDEDYLVIGFPSMIPNSVAPVSGTVELMHKQNLPGSGPGSCDQAFIDAGASRKSVYCYDYGAIPPNNFVSISTYTKQAAYASQVFAIPAACLSDATEANKVLIKVTFDPLTLQCGSMDIDYAKLTVNY